MKVIAKIHTDFSEKFGIPRQSGLVETEGRIVFEPEYRDINAVRGLDGYSHIWLIWGFDGFDSDKWSPTVRPPRLGGNEHIGVFATRSPNRPNKIGLSSVELKNIEITENGPVLTVIGRDMRDGTKIYDIKPYLKYTDSHPDATGGFAAMKMDYSLTVNIPDDLIKVIPESKREQLIQILSQDPRPAYHNDENRIYGMNFANMNIKFTVKDDSLTVIMIEKAD